MSDAADDSPRRGAGEPVEKCTPEQARWLVEQLRQPSAAFDFAETAVEPRNGQREATRFALAATIETLQNLNFPGAQLALLRGLFDAISDLDQGTVVPLLSPRAVDARPTDPTARWIGKAYLVAAVDAHVRLGAKPDDAAS